MELNVVVNIISESWDWRYSWFGCAVWLVLGRLSSQTCFRKPFHIFQAFPPKAGQGFNFVYGGAALLILSQLRDIIPMMLKENGVELIRTNS
ncbi:hypothetical protein E1A91_A05G290800v1 [Gossypium mustelinum]|uniref:Uncharacterized protein n=1 Tax=Gossypium mustelinum TaxID=34275 RepID=A0A5D2ZD86_GOSMU|nr:hypothetical protein E1A91_A05G290800v1 [Gossypium mustelinum]